MRLRKRRWIVLITGVLAAAGVFLYGKWREASNNGGQKFAEPFRIAGNLYYVGANDVTLFLLTGPEGDVLIDGGYPGTAPMIMASIARLGFNIRDVKILLNSHAHFDHAGGLAALQKASGAQLWVSEPDADVIAAGGAGDPSLGRFSFLSYLPFMKYPAPHVDHRFTDGTVVRLGPIELTAHVTPGHTPGCTSWSFPVRDGDRQLQVLEVCGLVPPMSLTMSDKETSQKIQAEFEHTFSVLHSLHPDIFLTAHAREFGRYRKFAARDTAKDPVEPFIDRAGYAAYIDKSEREFRREAAGQ
ncbi:MAG TPA: subclass B3 metallo-beta-lactamase [Gemmatimonadaceae bacterium]|nr:subclass B3 metallo-beta-lactamase [Gemmatimonadaceae bacterium]